MSITAARGWITWFFLMSLEGKTPDWKHSLRFGGGRERPVCPGVGVALGHRPGPGTNGKG